MHAGDEAMHQHHAEEAEKAFKEAVALAENLPPGDENMIPRLGGWATRTECCRDTTMRRRRFIGS
jgi:hypothetical protein